MTTGYGYHNRSSFSGASLLLIAAVLLCSTFVDTAQAEIVCIQCHIDLSEEYSMPVKLWRKSIHAENNITCDACHGGDPKDVDNAMSPDRGFVGMPNAVDIPSICGRCHVGVLKDFLASAHGRALGEGGPTCVTCHNNHLVLKASLDLINEKTCSQCHSYERARLIHDAMAQTEAAIVAMDARIADFRKTGTDTETLEKRLFAVRNSFHSLSHEVDVKKVRTASASIGADLAKIKTSLDELTATRQKRRQAGLLVVSVMLMTALLLHLLRKTYD